MKKGLGFALTGLWVLLMLVSYWFYLPALNPLELGFWFFVLEGLALALVAQFLWGLVAAVSSAIPSQKAANLGRTRARDVTKQTIAYGRAFKLCLALIVGILLILGGASLFSSRVFRAKSYAGVIQVKEADFAKDFPETDVSKLALLDRASAEKIGDTYLGTIDKVSQFGISDAYRQITIGQQPYRVSPLEYKNFWKWMSNRKEGIGYYVKVNQTTGKAELVKLKEAMKYSDSEYLFRDTLRHLRLQHPTTIFGQPSFEVDDEGNPYYVATVYRPKFLLSSKDPVGAIILDAVTGKSKAYDLKDIPEWVDRVYSADNVISRVDDYYTYQNGFWNTVFSQSGVKKTTDSYNYIAIGSDIYLYTGITSATADSSNLGFILVNMRTRQVTNYKLASATETAAQASAEGEVQEKKYKATAPILTKLAGQAYYLVSLKDDAGLVKSYALVDAEDYQQVTVNNDIEKLIAAFTDADTSALTGASADQSATSDKQKQISGKVEQLASQIIAGTTVYYIQSNGQIYKIKASQETTDQLPFLKIGDHFTAQVGKDNNLDAFAVVSAD